MDCKRCITRLELGLGGKHRRLFARQRFLLRAEKLPVNERKLLRYGSRTVAVARHATPSPRPANPRRSVVVALTPTRPMSSPAILATQARMASRCGPILGA